jgi:hypothetical protein
MKLWTKALPLAAFFIISTSFAADSIIGISPFVEPYAGYGLLGGMDATTNNVTTNSGNFTGFGMGARAGATLLSGLIFGGLDVSYYPSYRYSKSATDINIAEIDSGTKNMKLGLVAGVNLPILPLRAWVGFNFIDRLTDSYILSGTTYDAVIKGNSFKLGVGYKVLPILSLNAEYIMASFGTIERTLTATGVTNTTTTTSLSHKLLFLSASVPLSF